MARNQSHASRIREPSRVPAWVWLFSGTLLGAFVMFLIHLSEVSPETSGASKIVDKKVENAAQKPRFVFYDLLKQTDIPVMEAPATEKKSRPSATDTTEYLLQVASFKSSLDAEQLRAELILLNLQAYTEVAKIRNGETWHRVIVGPFTSKSKLSKARSALLSNRHEALVLKKQPQG